MILELDANAALTACETAIFRNQLRRIWEPYDVPLVWAQHDPRHEAQAVYLHVVIGQPPVAGVQERLSKVGLGSTVFMQSGLALDVLYASTSAVSRMLQQAHFRDQPFPRLPRALQERIAAEALARIVAHELGHVLLSESGHARHGLMRASFTPDDLAAGLVSFWLDAARADQLKRVGHCRAVAPTR